MLNFVTKKWIDVNDFSGGQYSANKNIRFKTPMLGSDLCDYSDAYIVLKPRICVTDTKNTNRRNKRLTFKNNYFITVKIIPWHQEVCGIIIEMKGMTMRMRIMLLLIMG